MCLTLPPEVRTAFTNSRLAVYVDCPEHGTTLPAHRLERTARGLSLRVIRGARRPTPTMSPRDVEAMRREAYCQTCYANASLPVDAAMALYKATREATEGFGDINRYPPLQAAYEQFRATLKPLPVREIQLRRDRAPDSEGCSSACTNGKRSCNCRCLGTCHGAGACICGTQNAAGVA